MNNKYIQAVGIGLGISLAVFILAAPAIALCKMCVHHTIKAIEWEPWNE